MRPIRRILLATDLTAACESAADVALEMASRFDAEVVVFHAYEAPAYVYPAVAVDALGETLEVSEDAAAAGVEALAARLRGRYARVRGVTGHGLARQEILAAITSLECDLVVMTTHGRSGLARALLGSVAELIVRSSPVPVVTVHPAPRTA